jgi:hypothetical protein
MFISLVSLLLYLVKSLQLQPIDFVVEDDIIKELLKVRVSRFVLDWVFEGCLS